MADPAVIAATDQAHAESEATLNKLICWLGARQKPVRGRRQSQ
jgi:hypothetical protein